MPRKCSPTCLWIGGILVLLGSFLLVYAALSPVAASPQPLACRGCHLPSLALQAQLASPCDECHPASQGDLDRLGAALTQFKTDYGVLWIHHPRYEQAVRLFRAAQDHPQAAQGYITQAETLLKELVQTAQAGTWNVAPRLSTNGSAVFQTAPRQPLLTLALLILVVVTVVLHRVDDLVVQLQQQVLRRVQHRGPPVYGWSLFIYPNGERYLGITALRFVFLCWEFLTSWSASSMYCLSDIRRSKFRKETHYA